MKITISFSNCGSITKGALIALFFLISCNQKADSFSRNMDSAFDKFPWEIPNNSTQEFSLGIRQIQSLFVIGDSILITHKTGSSLDYILDAYDLNSEQKLGSMLPYGRGPGEALGAATTFVTTNHLLIRDITKRVFFQIPLDSYLSDKQDTLTQEIPMNSFYFDCALVSDSLLIGVNGPFEPNGEFLLDFYNYRIDSLVKQFAPISTSAKIPLGTLIDAHSGFVSYNQERKKLVYAYMYQDAFEIFDVKSGKKVADNHGPEGFRPSYDVGTSGSVNYMKATEETKCGFMRLTTTSDHIFLMYSGAKGTDSDYHLGTAIYIFDWNGEPVGILKEFDLPIQTFTVNEKETVMYLVDSEGMLKTIDLKL